MATESASSDFASGNPAKPTDGLSAATGEKLRAADLGRKAADTVDQARSSVAAGLSTAAGALEDSADEGGRGEPGVLLRPPPRRFQGARITFATTAYGIWRATPWMW